VVAEEGDAFLAMEGVIVIFVRRESSVSLWAPLSLSLPQLHLPVLATQHQYCYVVSFSLPSLCTLLPVFYSQLYFLSRKIVAKSTDAQLHCGLKVRNEKNDRRTTPTTLLTKNAAPADK
jgi:hypothetical protein